MILRLYTIKDELSGEANPPVPQANDDVAVRTFYHSMKRNDSVADFNLYYLGNYDSISMFFEPIDNPRLIDTNDVKRKILDSLVGEDNEKKSV